MLSVHRLREYTLLLLRSRTGLHGLQYDIGPVTAFKVHLLVVYPVTGHPVGEAKDDYLAVEGQGPVAHLQVLLASTGSRTRLTDSHSTTSPIIRQQLHG